MPYEILYRETLSDDGPNIVYIKPPESFTVVRLNSSLTQPDEGYFFSFGGVSRTIREIFLPAGYPSSVSNDYATYQMWDTVQAACSTIGHALTTEAILKGVGVGDISASSLSAAITWILKDGVGMVSRIAFAWLTGSDLDCDCKKWRLVADFINDGAMLVELAIMPLVPSSYALQVLAVSSAMRAIVGVAGGATRAAVIHHQAIKENMGDVSAKDGSQETCVNLFALILAIFILSSISSPIMAWCVFAAVTVLHLFANYQCVRSLVFNTFNAERHHIVLEHYLKTSTTLTPEQVSKKESVLLGLGLTDKKWTGCSLKLGSSLSRVTLTPNKLKLLANLFKHRDYFTMHAAPSEVLICLNSSHSPRSAISAFFHGSIVAICSSIANGNEKLRLSLSAGMEQSDHLMSKLLEVIDHWEELKPVLSIDQLIEIDLLIEKEIPQFLSSIEKAGWTTKRHQLHSVDGGWRADWLINSDGRFSQA